MLREFEIGLNLCTMLLQLAKQIDGNTGRATTLRFST